jgi:DNA-binding LacI/PurR family transcriptional regulator
MKKITIRDVAKSARVSYVTVSNVINNTGRMSEKTKIKVLKVIEKLNFFPDLSARTLARGKSDVIAFVSSYLSSSFVIAVLSGAERRLFEMNKFKYNLEHYGTRGATEIKENLLKNILYGKKADAVIMLTIKPEPKLMAEFKAREIPVILIENKAAGAHTVRIDNYKGAYAATEHLIKSGRKKIFYLSGPLGPSAYDEEENPVVKDRLKGYMDALHEYNIEYDPKKVMQVVYFNQEEGIRSMDIIKKAAPDIDAIFAGAGDMVALGVMKQAAKYGIKIPDDIALVGYDDIEVAGIMTPSLTTVRQPMDEMGKVAFDIAVRSLEKEPLKIQNIVLQPQLIVRDSA